MVNIPYGYCQCGCGQKTNPAPKTRSKLGNVKGEPQRFMRGHKGKDVAIPDNYTVTDTGYKSPCWVWNGPTNGGGYVLMYRRGYGGHSTAHRIFYERVHGPVPRNVDVHHDCRVRNCVNPDHLRPMSRKAHFREEFGRLTLEDAEAIRQEYAAGGASQRAISIRYGISQQNVSTIVLGRRWGPN